MNVPRYSLIIPSRGDRPKALGMALDSVLLSATQAALLPADVEILVGFDGVRGKRIHSQSAVRYFDLPADHDFGNGLRQALLKASRGARLIFLDDDNALTPQAFSIYEQFPHADMLIARIDVSRAHPLPFLPVPEEGKPLIRPCNIDPLCLCLTQDLVLTRCGGWQGHGYEADYRNILNYSRRAAHTAVTDQLVGVYDAGRGLDEGGRNFRQEGLQDPTDVNVPCNVVRAPSSSA
ncbi:MAG: glycosyl transferase family 2 [Desulfovibrionaceae bacterium]